MTIEEAIEHCEEVAKEQRELFRLCPIPSDMCDPTKDCASLKNGKNRGCIKCAEEHRQLAEWLKELKSFKEKDEAKAVHYEGDGYADGKMVYDTAFCPSCEHEFEEDSENWKSEFCPNCGQRLRWEE